MFTTEEIFDALFERATGGEGAERLFGPLVKKENRITLHEKLCGRHFSQLFLEFPLAGEAGFDLHIIQDGEDIRKGVPFPDEIYGGHGRLFSWFGSADRGGAGLDVVHDFRYYSLLGAERPRDCYMQGIAKQSIAEGIGTPPMVYLKTSENSPGLIEEFFRQSGNAEAAERFREKRALLPEGWCVWYTGVHTGRRGRPLRLGSFLTDELKERYAKNIAAFEETLAAVGFPGPLSPAMRAKLRELFHFQFTIDIQIDVMEDGSVGDTLGVSLTTGDVGRDALAASFEGGEARDLMWLFEEWGVADDRWRRIPAATFQVSTVLRSREYDRRRFILSGHIGFLKVRFCGTGPLAYDAKGYLNLAALPS